MEKKEIIVTRSLLEANDLIANRVRNNIRGKTFFVNIISSPGSGKTTLLEKTSDILKKDYSVAIITADIETDRDKKRLEREGVKVIQLNTMGGCHLEASIMEQLFGDLLKEKKYDFIFVENIGNLICPTEFDLGEHVRVLLLSTPEGDDKVKKYPLGFKTSHMLLVTKSDLLSVLEFDTERVMEEALQLNPSIRTLLISSKTCAGFDQWIDFLIKERNTCMNSA
jgi:hydrogenase nickel incorporation protein HypB